MERIQSHEEIEGMRMGVQVQRDNDNLASREELEGTRLGMEMMRNKQ
jgi:hypothetical protein